MALTDTRIKNARPGPKTNRLLDEKGLNSGRTGKNYCFCGECLLSNVKGLTDINGEIL